MLNEKKRRQTAPVVPAVNPLQAVLSQLISSNADPKTLMLIANALQQQQQQVAPPPPTPSFPMFNANQMAMLPNPLINPPFTNLGQNPFANQMMQQQMNQSHPQPQQQPPMSQNNIADMLNKLKNVSQPPVMHSNQNQMPNQAQFNQFANQQPFVGYNQNGGYQPPTNPQGYTQQMNQMSQQPMNPNNLQGSATSTSDLLAMLASFKK